MQAEKNTCNILSHKPGELKEFNEFTGGN